MSTSISYEQANQHNPFETESDYINEDRDIFVADTITLYNIHDINVNKGDGIESGFLREMCLDGPEMDDDPMIDVPYSIDVIEDFNKRTITRENINYIISLCDWLMVDDIQSFIYKNVSYSETELSISNYFIEKFNLTRFLLKPNTPETAIILGNLTLLKTCLQPDITPRPRLYNLALDAASHGRIDCFDYLISIQPRFQYIISALQSAIENGHFDFIQHVMDKNPYLKTKFYCFHLFEHSISCNKTAISEYLIKLDPFTVSFHALAEAIIQDNMELVILCVTYGAPIHHEHFHMADNMRSQEIYDYLKQVAPESELHYSPTNVSS
jgi:hypothetical protein